jgi:hypothetical protein
MTDPSDEPVIHSHHTDVLPDSDARAFATVYCDRCGHMVHASNNECMTTWIEWGPHVLCGGCAAPLIADGVLEFHEWVERAKQTTDEPETSK